MRRSDGYNEKSCAAEKQSEAGALFTSRWRDRVDRDYESMWPQHFAAVERDPQGLVQMRVVKHFPELIYGLPISPRMVGNHALDRSQCKREKCVAAVLQGRSYRLGADQLAESHDCRGVSKVMCRG
jgi:hypothetical protein